MTSKKQQEVLGSELEHILQIATQRDIQVVVIGFHAVSVYTARMRATADIDLLVPVDAEDTILSILQDEGYQIQESGLMYIALKREEEVECRIDVMSGQVVNESPPCAYPLSAEIGSLQRRELRLGRRTIEVTVPSVEGLLVMKLLSFRDQDIVDLLSLLSDRLNELDIRSYRRKAMEEDNDRRIQGNIIELASRLEEGSLDGLWQQYYAKGLLQRQKTDLKRALKKLEM